MSRFPDVVNRNTREGNGVNHSERSETHGRRTEHVRAVNVKERIAVFCRFDSLPDGIEILVDFAFSWYPDSYLDSSADDHVKFCDEI